MAEELARLKEEALIEKTNLRRCLRVLEILEFSLLRICLLLLRAHLFPWHLNYQKQRNVSEHLVVEDGGTKFVCWWKLRIFFLFNSASTSRCQLRDREIDCSEKDAEIKDMKEKIVNLVRHLELQKAEFTRQDLMGFRSSMVFDSGLNGHELLEDMDTSDEYEPDASDLFTDDDTDWENIKRKKRQSRKGNSKTDDPSEISMDLEGENPETSTDQVCCSCSRSSSCKTSRFECRAARGNCNISCNCEPTRCSNREEVYAEDFESAGPISGTDDAEQNHGLASCGARLLQNALSEKPADTNDGGKTRKPLANIGNNMAISGVPRPMNRKKWHKSVIQLVPAPPPTSQAQNVEASIQPKSNDEKDIPLKLPRAMLSTLTNSNLLKERNSVKQMNRLIKTVTLQPLEVQIIKQEQRMGKKIMHCKLLYLNSLMILGVVYPSAHFWCFMDSLKSGAL